MPVLSLCSMRSLRLIPGSDEGGVGRFNHKERKERKGRIHRRIRNVHLGGTERAEIFHSRIFPLRPQRLCGEASSPINFVLFASFVVKCQLLCLSTPKRFLQTWRRRKDLKVITRPKVEQSERSAGRFTAGRPGISQLEMSLWSVIKPLKTGSKPV